MISQAKPARHDLWRSPRGLALAIDAAPGPPVAGPLRAWLSGSSAIVERGAELMALEGLEEEDLRLIKEGLAIVVEFGPEGPRREAPVLPSEPAKV